MSYSKTEQTLHLHKCALWTVLILSHSQAFFFKSLAKSAMHPWFLLKAQTPPKTCESVHFVFCASTSSILNNHKKLFNRYYVLESFFARYSFAIFNVFQFSSEPIKHNIYWYVTLNHDWKRGIREKKKKNYEQRSKPNHDSLFTRPILRAAKQVMVYGPHFLCGPYFMTFFGKYLNNYDILSPFRFTYRIRVKILFYIYNANLLQFFQF